MKLDNETALFINKYCKTENENIKNILFVLIKNYF